MFSPTMKLTIINLFEGKQYVRNQAQTETHNDPENEVADLQQFHKPTVTTIHRCCSGVSRN